jgi:hypothetical protein
MPLAHSEYGGNSSMSAVGPSTQNPAQFQSNKVGGGKKRRSTRKRKTQRRRTVKKWFGLF